MSIRSGFGMGFDHGWLGPNAAVLVGRFDAGAGDGLPKIQPVFLPLPCAVEFVLIYTLETQRLIL
jgi:hypothetical protein